MAQVKRIRPVIPPPPPDSFELLLSQQEAEGLFTLLWRGTSTTLLSEFSLNSLLEQLKTANVEADNRVNIYTLATGRER